MLSAFRYCGSCYAQAAAASLADRIQLMRKKTFPMILLSVQALINCVRANNTHGCRGGDSGEVYEWIYENGVPDVTCLNYVARDEKCVPLDW